jgi:hypothetical protein
MIEVEFRPTEDKEGVWFMKTLTPILSLVCLATVGVIAAADHVKDEANPARLVNAYVGDRNLSDPLDVAVDRLENGEDPGSLVNVIANGRSETELEYAAWRWQNLREIGKENLHSTPEPAPRPAAAANTSRTRPSAGSSDSRANRRLSVYARSKKYTREQRGYRNAAVGARYRGKFSKASRFSRTVQSRTGQVRSRRPNIHGQ